MERDDTRGKKRTRDGGGEDKTGPHKGKKRETVSIERDPSDKTEKKPYEFSKEIGVFDFPWLKEGAVFIADDEGLADEKLFDSCSYFEEAFDTLGVNYFHRLHDEYDFRDNKFDDDGFCSLEIDHFEAIDCIWSCIDQPVDMGLNKG